ncbi:MAG TPA: restriction endonuclease subunit S [Candidatus Methanoperedens sp.]|nr:restriction endonuclease subunit S [Candidatus Methanoperedens sp.]
MKAMKTVQLSELCDINPESIAKDYPYDFIEYIDISSVSSGHLAISPQLLSISEAPSRAKRIVKNEDIIISMVRPNLRSFMFITNPKENTIVSTGFAVLRTKPGIYPGFVYYAITDHKFTEYLANNAIGTSYPAVDTDTILRGEIPNFSYDIQHKIASILSAYDSLIENNRRRIQLLEQSARLLYREWFVHLRFPGHEHIRIIDGVPEGWKKRYLVDLADLVMGQSPKSEFYNEEGEGLPFHQGVTNFGDRFVNHEIYCTIKNRLANPGDILCSVRAPVGRLNLTIDEIVIGRGLAAIHSKSNHQSFLYYQLKNHFFKEDMIGGGAIFAAVTKKDMEKQELLCPPHSLIIDFEEISIPIDNQLRTLHLQNNRLRRARDILLPRLMNGEITV